MSCCVACCVTTSAKRRFRICSTDLYVNGRIGKNITYLLLCEYRVLCSPAPTILCCELSCCVTGCMAISGHVPRGHDARSKDVPSRGIRYYCRVNYFRVIKLFDSLGKEWVFFSFLFQFISEPCPLLSCP